METKYFNGLTSLLVVGFVSGLFYLADVLIPDCKRPFVYDDKIKVIAGFYAGKEGTVLSENPACEYLVEFKNSYRTDSIKEDYLHIINKGD